MTTPAREFLMALPPFAPRPWLGNGHAMTVYAWARTRIFPDVPAPEPRLFGVAAGSQVLAHCYWHADRCDRPTLLALHGLEGSSGVHYMRGLAAKAWRRGWNAILLNQRNCGGTEHLTPTLYHSGLTADPLEVMRVLTRDDGLGPFGVVGYSLGGNLAVKLSGELGASPDVHVAGVAAISPTIDLERCVRAIERRPNIPYHFNFVRNLKARMRRKSRIWPDAFDVSALESIWTIRKFDDVYTAPSHGFGNAANYYFQASALRQVARIRTPTLIVAAKDDPFVPPDQFEAADVTGNPHVGVALQAHGGHCGFVTNAARDGDGYWAEDTALGFLATVMRR